MEKWSQLDAFDVVNCDELMIIRQRALTSQEGGSELSHAMRELAVAAEKAYHILNLRPLLRKN